MNANQQRLTSAQQNILGKLASGWDLYITDCRKAPVLTKGTQTFRTTNSALFALCRAGLLEREDYEVQGYFTRHFTITEKGRNSI